jgi:Na+/alanine symporter
MRAAMTPYRWCAIVVLLVATVVVQEVANPFKDYAYGIVVWQAVVLLLLFGDEVVREARRLWGRARAARRDVL